MKWPGQEEVDRAVRAWIIEEGKRHPGLRRVGYFGSYARGDWGVGSDLDVIAVVDESREAFERRSRAWDLYALPVPAELLVYTEKEWERLRREGGLFWHRLVREIIWIYQAEG